MTTERDNNEMEEFVSTAYREHSVEKVPEDLNRRILDIAASEISESRGFTTLFSAWTKPLAFAATIGLSLAIVLEVSQMQDGPINVAPPAAKSVSDEFKVKDNSQFEDIRNQAKLRSGMDQEVVLDAQASDGLTAEDRANGRAEDPREQQQLSTPQSSAAAPAPALEQAPAQADTSKSDMAVTEMEAEILEESTSSDQPVARLRQSPARDAEMDIAALASFSDEIAKKEADSASTCDETIRTSRSDWLACIENMRLAGAIEDADREYEEFVLRFPDE
jgi:hypothetical protein